jgi:adenosylcobinamide kinase/adenosylcobinamide-phosphate guanylyltransferase
MSSQLILILGGARSGKSSYAEKIASQMAEGGPVLFIATAEPLDEEMRMRIDAHKASRPQNWLTIEAPLDPGSELAIHPQRNHVHAILLDCLTLLVSNLMIGPAHNSDMETSLDGVEVESRIISVVDSILTVGQALPGSMVLVSNEVGLGLVPPYPLGRIYRDILGRVNMYVASKADSVLFMISGIPMKIKP